MASNTNCSEFVMLETPSPIILDTIRFVEDHNPQVSAHATDSEQWAPQPPSSSLTSVRAPFAPCGIRRLQEPCLHGPPSGPLLQSCSHDFRASAVRERPLLSTEMNLIRWPPLRSYWITMKLHRMDVEFARHYELACPPSMAWYNHRQPTHRWLSLSDTDCATGLVTYWDGSIQSDFSASTAAALVRFPSRKTLRNTQWLNYDETELVSQSAKRSWGSHGIWADGVSRDGCECPTIMRVSQHVIDTGVRRSEAGKTRYITRETKPLEKWL